MGNFNGLFCLISAFFTVLLRRLILFLFLKVARRDMRDPVVLVKSGSSRTVKMGGGGDGEEDEGAGLIVRPELVVL